ncbi:zinc ribbon domain-containing protein [Nocardioides nematodiphilus]|uniref:zinc ribbon domain-containing protein n=1 Tax=Nocardioides nematodiphilus TaxID=2849669 RepID=UPI001CD9E171|nr:C4-type zinc ribbon domain-containing protein [Nocardioides nematodiphilus]MCA1982282.1 C4-type zinc ribbon domain-containing protein [Nocardioides nematodiphilus]
MKADPFAQLKLLDIAEIDARILQLRHQLKNLPESKQIAELQIERKKVDDTAIDFRIQRDDLAVAVAKAEKDVEAVRVRRTKEQARIDAGQVTNPKDLERLQAELANIDRRIGVLEDEELEVMEQLDEATKAAAGFDLKIDEFDARIQELTNARTERAADVERELASITADRGPAIEGMPADLMALYDRIREQSGIGAAELRAKQCGGCRLSVEPAELSRIRTAPSDEVIRHEECGVIMVRTAESGL